MAPIVLESNQPPNRFYKGGSQISAFRSAAPSDTYQPEDWVASTTCCNGQDTLGLTQLENGSLLRDSIENEPEYWLGEEHVKKFGTSTKLLVKLLDAGQRLPVHAHPHREWAHQHLGVSCGKAEMWFTMNPGTVWLGLREKISPERLRELVDKQESDTLRSMMHEIKLQRHQAVYVPPGVLHAIGEGLLVAEVQEPSDLSVLCEWKDFAIDGTKDGHLGLGFETALTAIERSARTTEEMTDLVTAPAMEGVVCSPASREYFRTEYHHVIGHVVHPRGFAILIVLDGHMELETSGSGNTALSHGFTVVIPHSDGDFSLRGEGSVFIARPPQV